MVCLFFWLSILLVCISFVSCIVCLYLVCFAGRLQQLNESLASEQKLAEERHRAEMSSAWQLQELAAMLHESHRALVSTNDHLLQELEETRERHVQEVMQMSANYEHIRKSVDLMQQL